ncbi:SCO family protein [Luteirhabdus pelagi]|jgi:protein SCO1/2|uniref:SCO family protein n=1 Tax=Luteirhabdus pelagi TaxID=2792783 RepID=UPI00193937E9|nr:SCO family protein [Luteirhabdus pelagi]
MKKKYSYIGLAVIILIFGIIVIPEMVDRLKGDDVVKMDRMSTQNAKNVVSETDLEDNMVTISKVPNYSFVNQHKDTITDAYYDGKVYVVEFFFATCPSICPVMNDNMLQVQKAFQKENDFGIASITIDPANDTPEALKTYAENLGVSHPHWNFLTGDRSDVMALSNEGFKLYAAENEEVAGGFEHSGMFALIDKEGNVRSRIDENGNPLIYYDGLSQSGIDMLIEDIKKLL